MMFSNSRDTSDQRNIDELELPLFEFHVISNATNSFSLANKLGEGGFGTVYRVNKLSFFTWILFFIIVNVKKFTLWRTQGRLVDGQEIAVKRLSTSSGQGNVEFKNEVRLIAKLQHRNLVRLFGCCIEKEEKMLIYEYMENNSLDYILFGKFMTQF